MINSLVHLPSPLKAWQVPSGFIPHWRFCCNSHKYSPLRKSFKLMLAQKADKPMRYEVVPIWPNAKNGQKVSGHLNNLDETRKILKLALDSFQILFLLERQEWIFHPHRKLHLRLNRTKISTYLCYHFEPKNWLKRYNFQVILDYGPYTLWKIPETLYPNIQRSLN